MKEVIDLNGNTILVPLDTPVRATKGKHYLLNADELLELDAKEQEWLNNKPDRDLEAIYDKRNAERGTWQEQWEFFIDNGYSALVARDNNIKARHPKPRKK